MVTITPDIRANAGTNVLATIRAACPVPRAPSPTIHRFDAKLALTARHLVGTAHEGHPREATVAVGEAVRAIPGITYVGCEWLGELAGTWAILGRLELVDEPRRGSDTLKTLRTAIDAAVTDALMCAPVPLPMDRFPWRPASIPI